MLPGKVAGNPFLCQGKLLIPPFGYSINELYSQLYNSTCCTERNAQPDTIYLLSLPLISFLLNQTWKKNANAVFYVLDMDPSGDLLVYS